MQNTFLLLDVITNFKYSLQELKEISGATSLTIEGIAYDQPMALFGARRVRFSNSRS